MGWLVRPLISETDRHNIIGKFVFHLFAIRKWFIKYLCVHFLLLLSAFCRRTFPVVRHMQIYHIICPNVWDINFSSSHYISEDGGDGEEKTPLDRMEDRTRSGPSNDTASRHSATTLLHPHTHYNAILMSSSSTTTITQCILGMIIK